MPKGSYGRFIHVGLVGPKPRPNGVGDGQTVYIPLPLVDDTVRRTRRGRPGVAMEMQRPTSQGA
jgi:hypothetical protein